MIHSTDINMYNVFCNPMLSITYRLSVVKYYGKIFGKCKTEFLCVCLSTTSTRCTNAACLQSYIYALYHVIQ